MHEKKVPYVVEKPVPVPQHVYIDRPVLHEKEVPFAVVSERPFPVKVGVAPAHQNHYESAHYPEHQNYHQQFISEHQHIPKHHQHIQEPHHSYTSFSGYGGAYSYHH